MRARFAPIPVLRQELIRERRLDGLRITESRHRALSTIEQHAHERAAITILVDGSFEESYRFASDVICFAPAVHIRPAGELHRDRLGTTGAVNIVLELDAGLEARIRSRSPILDGIRHLADPRSVELARAVRRELMIDDDASALALEGLTFDLLAAASRRRGVSTQPPRWLLRVRELLHDRFRERGLRLAELAATAGTHPTHVARAFRRHFGTSPGAYLRRLRVDWAREVIASSHRPLVEIAADAGFADQSHLSRVFKAATGTTPAAWRRRHAPRISRSVSISR